MGGQEPARHRQTPITVEDVLNSRMIAYPFRLLRCYLMTNGGGALILVSAERACDFPRKPVYLLGTGESVDTPMVSQMEYLTSSRLCRSRACGLPPPVYPVILSETARTVASSDRNRQWLTWGAKTWGVAIDREPGRDYVPARASKEASDTPRGNNPGRQSASFAHWRFCCRR
jgi:hypothetical protein